MRSDRGLTLAELTIAVVVAGILASIAAPSYGRTVERAHFRTAGDVLQTTYAGEKLLFSATNKYVSAATHLVGFRAFWSQIYMDPPAPLTGETVRYIVVADNTGPVAGRKFTATAQRRGGPGGEMTIDQTRTVACTGAWDGGGGVCQAP